MANAEPHLQFDIEMCDQGKRPQWIWAKVDDAVVVVVAMAQQNMLYSLNFELRKQQQQHASMGIGSVLRFVAKSFATKKKIS